MPGKPDRATHAWTAGGHTSRTVHPADILDQVEQAGLGRANTALARQLVRPASDVDIAVPDISQVLPVPAALAPLCPWPGGIRRGATVAAVGSTSLLLAFLSGALSKGSWGAVVGLPDLGMAAAAEAGVPLDRLALVPAPGPDWPAVVATLIDGFALVVAAAPPDAAEAALRALMNRARQRACVLLTTTPWPGCDLTISLTARRWVGLGAGHGRLRHLEMTLRAVGRGRAARARIITVAMPALAASSTVGAKDDVEPRVPVSAERPALTVADDPWAAVEPTEAPADPWAELVHRIPGTGRRQR